jgi:pimeloyl-ACP methyl ester carboxylesterase
VTLAVYEHDVQPGAPRVVLVHGSMDRAASFAKVTRRLGELDVVRYDRRGYGRSRDDGIADTIDEHVDDLLDVLGSAPTPVVGHSLGGVIALAAAQRHPDRIPSVGAYESPMSWAPTWPTRSAGSQALLELDAADAAERFMRGMLGDAVWERLPSRTRASRRAEGAALVAELASMREVAPYDPVKVEVPVLAGYGTESKPYHQDAARELARRAPQGELIVIDGAGHGAPMSHPTVFAEFVRRVVARSTYDP